MRLWDLQAMNQPVVVQHLSEEVDDEIALIHAHNVVGTLTNMAELGEDYHRDQELELSPKASSILHAVRTRHFWTE